MKWARSDREREKRKTRGQTKSEDDAHKAMLGSRGNKMSQTIKWIERL